MNDYLVLKNQEDVVAQGSRQFKIIINHSRINDMKKIQHDAMLARYLLWSCVRTSVCLSVRRKSEFYQKTAKSRITETALFPSQETLLPFSIATHLTQFDGVTPNGSAKYWLGGLKSAIFDQYLATSQKLCKT